jgi:predicted pyridoxine 5'-phosphate oxidase superfamily flavin-nucleotide-binding protein
MHACQSEAQPGEGLGPREAEYLANADSFYMATASEMGWPYVQHRGGPRGFLKVISPTQLAFADFLGNRQYVSVGNAAGDARVSIIVVDYASQRRLKLLGRLRFEEVGEADPEFVFAVELPHDPTRVERVAAIEVEAVDWNCPQHITPRFTLEEIDAASKPLHERIAQLEAEVVALRMQLAPQTGLSRWEESCMEDSSTLAAVHTGSRAGEDARRRRCLEHPRSGARFARLHAGQHVAQPRRVPCWPRGRRADDHPGLSDLGL